MVVFEIVFSSRAMVGKMGGDKRSSQILVEFYTPRSFAVLHSVPSKRGMGKEGIRGHFNTAVAQQPLAFGSDIVLDARGTAAGR